MKIFCVVENCQKHANGAKGMCSMHYGRSLYGSSEATLDMSPMPKCDVPECANRAEHREEGSLCMPHYQLKFRGKDPYTHPYVFSNRGECWCEGCPKAVTAKGLCNYHYRRAARGLLEVPESLGVVLNPPCSFEGCTRLQESGGLCHSHNEQRRKGSELTALRSWGKFSAGETKCLVKACEKAAHTVNFCRPHSRAVTHFKMTPDEAVELFENESCANPRCSNTTRLHIDHDHTTGKVRALLCGGCNTALGHIKEDVERLQGLVEYKLLHG